jgi:hypothetical protein
MTSGNVSPGTATMKVRAMKESGARTPVPLLAKIEEALAKKALSA